MPTVKIEDKGCRGCTLCVDICPCDVFDYVEADQLAKVSRQDDCIGCFSCFYLCPSACIELGDVELQRPFYRIEQNAAFVEKFLQARPASKALAEADWEEAYKDVSVTMASLSTAIVEMLGRGTRALGRKSGAVAAAHLPEIYEERGLEGVLDRLRERFEHSFPFTYERSGEEVTFTFEGCGCNQVVTDAGGEVGKAVLCQLFHDYLAGLIGAYTGTNYRHTMPRVGQTCVMKLAPP
jgi:NAD-dependent dihydropyrimidine dehydrogenase PreA subunit